MGAWPPGSFTPPTPVATEDWIESFDEIFKDYFVVKTGMLEDHKEVIKNFISSYKKIWEEEEKIRLIKIVEEGIEKYKVPKEAKKINQTGSDYIFVYDLKTFILAKLTTL